MLYRLTLTAVGLMLRIVKAMTADRLKPVDSPRCGLIQAGPLEGLDDDHRRRRTVLSNCTVLVFGEPAKWELIPP
jgi:hypothetical protein